MSQLLPTAFGLGFTLFVCLYVAHALLVPWLRQRASADEEKNAATHTSHPHGTARAHMI